MLIVKSEFTIKRIQYYSRRISEFFRKNNMNNSIIHLTNPAEVWDNALPVGNGIAGLMAFGGVSSDKLTFNEESVWSGGEMNTYVEGFADSIKYLRELFINDKEEEADAWAAENMKKYIFGIKSYEYAGVVNVKLHDNDECENYRRDLDLDNALLNISYDKDGAHYEREYFASYPSSLICLRYSANTKFGASLDFTRENTLSVTYTADTLEAHCKTIYGENEFKLCAKIKTDGASKASADGIRIEDASYIELYFCIVTSFKYDDLNAAENNIIKNAEKSYDELKKEHIADFTALMGRSSVSFDEDEKLSELTPGERIERLKNDPDAHDYSLMALYWKFAKYLLIGSSRVGTLPANLQGVWADGLKPAWSSDYHTNINIQMNYWHAEEANISECTSALFDYMNNYLLPGGKKFAKESYGTRGMVVHHLSDIYQFAAVADGLHGLWPLGGAWLAYHMWEHYLYTEDVDFLRNTAYQYIRECAEFFFDNMFEGKDGYMHTGPSTSPENHYYKEVNGEKKHVTLAISPTMDIEVVGGLFDFYAKTEDILGICPENAAKAREIRAKMPPLSIGARGQLMEWYKDYEEIEPGHRHISHAFALYPSAEISRNTPELFAAIERTLDLRLASGGGHTGWSRAWLVNLFARLGKADKAYENIRALFTRSTLPNLFDTHPPFQIDGNFGGAAGIGEMIMQSHEGYIAIIPALPDAISGSFENLKARGNITVSAEWKNGKVTKVTLYSEKDKNVKVKLPGGEIKEVALKGGISTTL